MSNSEILLQDLPQFTISKTKYAVKPITYISFASNKENYTVYSNEQNGFIMTASKNKKIIVDVIIKAQSDWQTFLNFSYPSEIEELKVKAIEYLTENYKKLQPQGKVVADNLKDALTIFSENPLTPNDIEQEEISQILVNEKRSKNEILNRLLNLKPTDPEIIIINSKTFKRDNRTVAEIKYLRNFTCQICGTSIKTKEGSSYIEAAHIKPKFLKGAETLDNIILLCPNHHKEFDLGERIIVQHTRELVSFILNGKNYTVKLIPDLY